MRNLLIIAALFASVLIVSPILAATTDFTADANVTVTGVTFGATTADVLIMSGSTAESWSFDSGTFTVTNPGTFQVGSSDTDVNRISFELAGVVEACDVNTTAGTSYTTAPTTAGT